MAGIIREMLEKKLERALDEALENIDRGEDINATATIDIELNTGE